MTLRWPRRTVSGHPLRRGPRSVVSLRVTSLAALALAVATACDSASSASTEAPTTSQASTDTTTLPATDEPPDSAATSTTEQSTSTVLTESNSSPEIGALDFNTDADPQRNPSVFGYHAFDEVDEIAVSDTLSQALGEADADTGWTPMPVEYACSDVSEYRSLLWDDIRFVLVRRTVDSASTFLWAWSIGEAALTFSPPLNAEIMEASGIATADGIALNAPVARLDDVNWNQSRQDDGFFLGLAGNGPVVFRLDENDRVVGMSYERNDC